MNCMNSLQVFQFGCFYHLGWLVLCRRHRCFPPHVGLRFCRMQAVYVTDSPSPRLLGFFLAKDIKPMKFQVKQSPMYEYQDLLMFLFINSLTSKAINSVMSKLPYFLLRKQYCPSCVIFSGYYKKKKKVTRSKTIQDFPLAISFIICSSLVASWHC